ncbi:MAG: pyridoxal-phosphate dependent enzyme [Candidatus Paceibacterota bacterium]|jgi:cysteine synthase
MKNKTKQKKVFEGENAFFEFLKPEGTSPTPLVELPKAFNPFHKDKVRIFMKLINFVPLFNIKSLPSYEMLSTIPENELKKIKHLVEYSSGNTVLSLTVLSKYFGIPNMHAIITPDVPEHKKRLLRLLGTNIMISHGPSCPDVFANTGGVYEAKKMGKKKGWHNLHQYINPANLKAGEKYVAKELIDQLGDNMTLFMCSIGTAGTIAGATKYLLKKNPKLKIIGTCIKEGSSIPGPRSESHIHKLAFPWEKTVHEIISMDQTHSFKTSLDLIRAGMFVGPSTGMQLSALYEKLKEYKKKNRLKELKNKEGEIVTCFLACDTMFPYIDDYFKNLPSSLFPEIKNI